MKPASLLVFDADQLGHAVSAPSHALRASSYLAGTNYSLGLAGRIEPLY